MPRSVVVNTDLDSWDRGESKSTRREGKGWTAYCLPSKVYLVVGGLEGMPETRLRHNTDIQSFHISSLPPSTTQYLAGELAVSNEEEQPIAAIRTSKLLYTRTEQSHNRSYDPLFLGATRKSFPRRLKIKKPNHRLSLEVVASSTNPCFWPSPWLSSADLSNNNK